MVVGVAGPPKALSVDGWLIFPAHKERLDGLSASKNTKQMIHESLPTLITPITGGLSRREESDGSFIYRPG